MVISLAGCGVSVTGVSFDIPDTLEKGSSIMAAPEYAYDGETPEAAKADELVDKLGMSYTSSDPNVLTVDENGNIKADAETMVMNDLRSHFRPEFLNRLDEIIMFKPLTKDNIGGIIELMLADVNKRLEDKELSIHLTDDAKSYVIEHGYEPAYGARPLKRYLTKHVDTLAARMILSGEVYPQDTIVIDEQGGELIASVEHRQ